MSKFQNMSYFGRKPQSKALVPAGRAASKTPHLAPVIPITEPEPTKVDAVSNRMRSLKELVQGTVIDKIDASQAAKLTRVELSKAIDEILTETLQEKKTVVNTEERGVLVKMLLDEMLGLGPLEPLLADDTITDILVNGANKVYIERNGKLELTDTKFRDDSHVINIAGRIASRVGRRVDESNPMVDARLEDGSRVNIVLPPLTLKGPSISIRKFSKQAITLEQMVDNKNLTKEMSGVLMVAARSRLNILISGGTGSGKTTLLNAMSRMIDPNERIITIEDAAELQLQQPHVVSMESKQATLEGKGEITIRHLLINSLRMRPDRIIIGEVRSDEVIDMLQAMNTGHDGSMGTVHANNPREALTRLENLIGMAGVQLPTQALRTQISSALDLIVQVERMRDGTRRIVSITEVLGMEGEVITTQELFRYNYTGEDADGKLIGQFKCTGLPPKFIEKAKYFELDRMLMSCFT